MDFKSSRLDQKGLKIYSAMQKVNGSYPRLKCTDGNTYKDKQKSHIVIDGHFLFQIEPRKNSEDEKCNSLLNDFELRRRKKSVSHSIGGDLEAIFKKRNSPRGQNHNPKSSLLKLQMAIPGKRHEEIAENEEADGAERDIHLKKKPGISAGLSL